MRQHFDIKHEGTVGIEGRVAMTFDENSIAHLMSVLTDLYSNRPLAVIREYSTNAWDAHVAAGNPDPIQITLPTAMNNTLIIKDYGTGMSKDDINEHFSKYGWSSKRDNDDEVGTLGLGCKSGLTYTSQFTLVTTQDGIKNVVLVTREESGGGMVQIIDTVQTDEPNGTEVQIPCGNWQEMVSIARGFFLYWDDGTVLIDGEKPECIWTRNQPGDIHLDDDILIIPYKDNGNERTSGSSRIVMGGIAYPIELTKLPYNNDVEASRFKAVVRVPIGSVNFTPSREALSYTKRTIDTIQTAWEFIFDGLQKRVQKEIDNAANAKEAFMRWQEWRYVFWGRVHRAAGRKHFTYQGLAFTDTIEVPDKGQTLLLPVKPAYWSNADRSERIGELLDLKRAYEAKLHVVGFKGTAIAATTKQRIRHYCELRGIRSGNVIVYPRPFGAPWLTNDTVPRVRFDVIQALKVPGLDDKPTKEDRPKFKYRTIDGENLNMHDDLPDTVLAWLPAGFREVARKDVANFSKRNTVAVVLAADEKKFQRDHPTIPCWTDWVKEQILAAPTSGTDWDNFFYWKHNYAWRESSLKVPKIFHELYADLVEQLADRDLRYLIEEYWAAKDSAQKFIDNVRVAEGMARFFSDIALDDVPKSTLAWPKIKRFIDFYGELLNAPWSLCTRDQRNGLMEAFNAFYILKSQLHVIPVL